MVSKWLLLALGGVLGLLVLNTNVLRVGYGELFSRTGNLACPLGCADRPLSLPPPTAVAMQWLQASSAGFRLRSWDMDESLETMTLRTVPTKDGSVFVTWVNFHFADFAVSWAENLRRNGIENMYIGAMDADTTRVRVVGCEGAAEGVGEAALVRAADLPLWPTRLLRHSSATQQSRAY